MGYECPSWLTGIVTVCAVLISIVYAYMKIKYTYWKKRNVHYLEPKFPFGNIKDMILQKKSFGEVFYDIYFTLEGHKYAGVYQVYAPTLVVRDPELIKLIMIKAFEHFDDHGFHFNEKLDPLSANLFMLGGTRWRNLRIKLSPTFTSGKMKMMFHTLAKCGEELSGYLDSCDAARSGLEIKELLARYSTDIISSCAFGIESNCMKNPDAEFRVWGRKIFATSTVQLLRDLMTAFLPSVTSVLSIPNTPRDVTNYFMGIVKETIDFREKNDFTRNDFMQLLLQLKNKGFVDPDRTIDSQNDKKEVELETTKLTFNEVAAQAFVFFAAGFETSSTTMTFCLYELALHVNIQKKLRNEINAVLSKYGGEVTYEAVQEMKYLDKVVSETLRLYPPVPTINRICTKTFTIEDTGDVIEKGVPIVIPIYGIQRDPKYFENPDSFNPENFSDEAVSQRPTFTYMPFGEGPRICIGQRFGLMQVKVGLISILRSNGISLNVKTPVPVKLDKKSFITAPMGGMWLNITKIK